MNHKLLSSVVSLALLAGAGSVLCQDNAQTARRTLDDQFSVNTASIGQPERVPDSSFENGKPQGMFVGIDPLSGEAICLLFLDGGRVTRSIPKGGLENFSWEEHKKKQSHNCGIYTLSG